MANEKKVAEVKDEVTAVAETEVVEVTNDKFPTLVLEREQFKGDDGQKYWSYMVRGKARGRDIKVDFQPKDKGGYEPLDLVFDGAKKADLVMREEVMTDDNGRKTKYMVYTARTTDEDGEIWECGVKPARDSDKSLLAMLLKSLAKEKAV